MSTPSLDSFKSRKTLKVGSTSYSYFSLPDAEAHGLPVSRGCHSRSRYWWKTCYGTRMAAR
jgi:hypothetical protein